MIILRTLFLPPNVRMSYLFFPRGEGGVHSARMFFQDFFVKKLANSMDMIFDHVAKILSANNFNKNSEKRLAAPGDCHMTSFGQGVDEKW